MGPCKVLVVDDEPAIRQLVQYNLEKAGLSVVAAADGEEALATFAAERPDLVLLDLMLPRLDGFTVCRRLREHSSVPIIMLTARTAEQDRVEGLDLGADDYLVKPFSPRELVARINAVLRRTEPASPAGEGRRGLVIDPERHTVTIDGRPVSLTPKEFSLLALLAAHPGRVYSRENLLDLVWGYEFPGDTRTVDVHVRRLRQKIEADPSQPALLETVHGVGYRLREKAGR